MNSSSSGPLPVNLVLGFISILITKIQPFECDKCGRAFADRSNMRSHRATHGKSEIMLSLFSLSGVIFHVLSGVIIESWSFQKLFILVKQFWGIIWFISSHRFSLILRIEVRAYWILDFFWPNVSSWNISEREFKHSVNWSERAAKYVSSFF